MTVEEMQSLINEYMKVINPQIEKLLEHKNNEGIR